MKRQKVTLFTPEPLTSKWAILMPEKGNINVCEMLEFDRYIDAARYFIDNNMYEKRAVMSVSTRYNQVSRDLRRKINA